MSVFFVPRTLSPDTETLSLDRTRASGTSHETANSQYGKGYPVRPYGVRYGRESDPPSHTRHITAHASRGVHHVYVPHHVPRPTTSHFFTSHYVPHYCTVYVPLLPTTSHYVPQCHYAPPPSAGRGRAVSVAVRLYQRPTATRRTLGSCNHELEREGCKQLNRRPPELRSGDRLNSSSSATTAPRARDVSGAC